MADRDIIVETPAAEQDLITLEECKLLLNISLADTSRDQQLEMQISIASAVLADMANRKPELGFGETTITETWRDIGEGRLFLMHWPLKPDGVIEISAGGTPLLPGDFRVDGNSGKVSIGGSGSRNGGHWKEPATVRYTGGYKLPEEAPLPLKQACALIVQEQRIRNQQAAVAGMRQIKHKEAQVSFYDPNALLLKTIGAKSPGLQAAETLLRPYLRLEV